MHTLGYDRSSQLIESVKTGASGGEQRSWRYDGAGNRILATRGNATTTSFHNALNQIERVSGAWRTLIEGIVSETATVKLNSLFRWSGISRAEFLRNESLCLAAFWSMRRRTRLVAH